MKYKLLSKSGQCSFEEYDKAYFNKTGKLKDCGCETSIKCGNNWVCVNHLSQAMLADKNPEMEDHRLIKKTGGSIAAQNKNEKDIKNGFKVIPFREDFIKLAKGEEINIRQSSMFDSSDKKPEKKEMTEEEKQIRKCEDCKYARCKKCKGAENQKTIIEFT
jgi:hypothetical protein